VDLFKLRFELMLLDQSKLFTKLEAQVSFGHLWLVIELFD
jgi:hypothetical protein